MSYPVKFPADPAELSPGTALAISNELARLMTEEGIWFWNPTAKILIHIDPAQPGPARSIPLQQVPSHLLTLGRLAIDAPPRATILLDRARSLLNAYLFPIEDALNRLPQIKAPMRLPAVVLSASDRRLVPATAGMRQDGWLFTGGETVLPAADPARHDFSALLGLFSDLPVHGEHGKGNLVAWTCACFARAALDEFPILVLDGQMSAGKTNVGHAVSLLLSGQPAVPFTYSPSQQELEQRVAATAANYPIGPALIFIDNVGMNNARASRVTSDYLCTAATTPVTMPRKMHVGITPVFAPVIALTMNNARVSGDLAPRCVVVRLVDRTEGMAAYMFKSRPSEYARTHRDAILKDIITVLSTVEMRPPTPGPCAYRMVGFQRICEAVQSTLGIPAGLGTDQDTIFNTNANLFEAAQLVIETAEDKGLQVVRITDVAQYLSVRERSYPELHAICMNTGGSPAKRGHTIEKILFKKGGAPITYDDPTTGKTYTLTQTSTKDGYHAVEVKETPHAG